MIDDDLLHDALEARADGAPDRLAEVARSVAVAHPRATGWQARFAPGQWAGAVRLGGTVAVAVVVLVFLALGPGRPTSPASPSGATAPTPAVTAPGSPASTGTPRPAPTAWTTLTWSEGDSAPFRIPGMTTYVTDSIAWRGGWLAVGHSFADPAGSVSGCIWTSADGAHWIFENGSWLDRQFDQVIEHDGRVVIVGVHRAPDVGGTVGPMSPAMWSSPDGVTWTEAQLPDALFGGETINASVASGPGGLLVHANDTTGTDRWILGDPGGDWRDVTPDPATFSGAWVGSFAGDLGGWVAVSATPVGLPQASDPLVAGRTPPTVGAAWWSSDGVHWTAAAVERPGTSMSRAVRVADGWIAMGEDNGGCAGCVGHPNLMWRSDDGRAWTPVDIALAKFYPLFLESYGGRGTLVDTDEGNLLRVRQTTDGRTWTDVSTALAPGWDSNQLFGLRQVAAGPDGLLGLGQRDGKDPWWPVPFPAVAGDPPATAATQAPFPTQHDHACLPAGVPCGP